ncbi:flagellar protein FlgJ [Desulfuromusa kysingii]|uniref:Flagellar protein FlgJ n=1 Tax=Desulfuromusa kysingii TaxID=37625 RepID=A0A1H3VGA5_9BACT|nr:rod-binding protein [Desulfuromusa kysingii]SDZ73796.1 flagellar protein FlgJ [Desulfuromusa kysingii]
MESRIDPAQLLSQTSQPVKAPKSQKPEELREVAQQFEAIFIQQMYKEMRKSIPNDGLIQRGNADDVYTQMQDMEAAKIAAQQGGIGLADLMMEQLAKQQ